MAIEAKFESILKQNICICQKIETVYQKEIDIFVEALVKPVMNTRWKTKTIEWKYTCVNFTGKIKLVTIWSFKALIVYISELEVV